MTKTRIEVSGEKFLINGRLIYSEVEGSKPEAHGLLMNARFIQGIFDDKADRERYNRFGRTFCPEKNTEDLIAALPQWYAYGLRAFTVGFQGGGPCFTVNNSTIDNNPFGTDGKSLDPAYAARMDRLIKAADELGMVVIVSYFYGAQAQRLEDGQAVLDATRTASRFLREGGYTNVIIEVANEHDINAFDKHPLLQTAEGMVALIEIARQEAGGLLVGCSGGGGYANKEICKASDVILIHGNGCSRQGYYNLINRAKEMSPGKPLVCNEDSQAIGQLEVAYKTRTSWGYYNNMTKQEPPTDWSVTEGEDKFFAYRMAEGIGIKLPAIPLEEQYYLQGFEADMEYEGKRWIRVASLYPEKINFVDFYMNGKLVYTSYEEPFAVNHVWNWLQGPWVIQPGEEEWKAVIHLSDGRVVEKVQCVK
jgi:hypothetical protein